MSSRGRVHGPALADCFDASDVGFQEIKEERVVGFVDMLHVTQPTRPMRACGTSDVVMG